MPKLMSRLALLVLASLAASAIAAPSAHAYIDPGSANFLVQIVVGAIAAAGLAIAAFSQRVRLFFGRLFGRNKPQEAVPEAEPPSTPPSTPPSEPAPAPDDDARPS